MARRPRDAARSRRCAAPPLDRAAPRPQGLAMRGMPATRAASWRALAGWRRRSGFLHQQLHCPLDGDAHDPALAIHPGILVQWLLLALDEGLQIVFPRALQGRPMRLDAAGISART